LVRDRKFFDRSGWEELIELYNFDKMQNKNNKSNEEIKIDNINIHYLITENSIKFNNIVTTPSTTSRSTKRPAFDLIAAYMNDENEEDEDFFYRAGE